jgi:hypothetical protein
MLPLVQGLREIGVAGNNKPGGQPIVEDLHFGGVYFVWLAKGAVYSLATVVLYDGWRGCLF